MNWLIEIDRQLLLAVNSWNAPWADTFMWLVSSRWLWVPLYLFLAWLLFRRFGWKRALWMLVVIGCAVGLADSGCHLLKHTVCRLRPTHEPALEGLLHLVRGYTGGLYGFPSSHAANTMTVALIFCLLFRRQTTSKSPWLLLLWVAANCWSRMYLGVHYPLDILMGLAMGVGLAFPAYRVCLLACPKGLERCLCRVAGDARPDAASGKSEPAAYGDASSIGGS